MIVSSSIISNHRHHWSIVRLLLLLFNFCMYFSLVSSRSCAFLSSSSGSAWRGGRRFITHDIFRRPSVSGILYEENGPTIKLFTKEGCTLCDKVKDVLYEIRNEYPHSLILMDITDRCYEQWYERYKFDIPVVHINDHYWAKHRLTRKQAIEGILAANAGTFQSPKGMPNAATAKEHTWKLEREQFKKNNKNNNNN